MNMKPTLFREFYALHTVLVSVIPVFVLYFCHDGRVVCFIAM
jgi:hypothetical protein